jgi:hypothetical protein
MVVEKFILELDISYSTEYDRVLIEDTIEISFSLDCSGACAVGWCDGAWGWGDWVACGEAGACELSD